MIKDEAIAASQGWMLRPVYDVRGYHTIAAFPVEKASHLKSAHHAQQFIWERAKQGDPICRKALQLIAAAELAGKAKSTRKKKSK